MKAGKVVKSLGMAAVALTLVSACMVGSTLAKYTSTISGTGAAIVAKWSLKGNLGSEPASDSTLGTFALKDTTKTVGVGTDRIAPGTSGSIAVNYDLNGSEVGANVEVFVKLKAGETDSLPANLVFKGKDGDIKGSDLNSTDYVKVYSTDISVDDIKEAGVGKGKDTYNVEWEWPFTTGVDDTADTTDGKDAASVDLDIKVVATQIQPTTTPAS